MNIRDRYEHDVHFRRVVDSISVLIEDAKFTPTEVREAAMLAQIIYEERHPRPVLLDSNPTLFDREEWLQNGPRKDYREALYDDKTEDKK